MSMKDESDIEELHRKSVKTGDALDDIDAVESIAPLIIAETLAWVLEKDDARPLLDEIDQDIEEIVEKSRDSDEE